MPTRSEHLATSKKIAFRMLEDASSLEQISDAWLSVVSDLGKHPETKNHTAINIGGLLLFGGNLSTREQMAKFINDIG